MKTKFFYLLMVFSLIAFIACKKSATDMTNTGDTTDEQVLLDAPEWSKNSNIYEVNIRQYTAEGTFNAFGQHLPRLKEMGVDILWLMPVHPISEKNRKGSLGSYYAVHDYKDVNPDFGSKEDFKNLVDSAHELGMKVILDWVPNHTGFDHIWTEEHPEWYNKNEAGEITYPEGTDWTDVADLNYDNKDMRKAMIDALLYWIKDFDIDGYRCDVAGSVPNDFWVEANTALFREKHVFMLAEANDPSHHEVGFHMSYGWPFHHAMNQRAKGEISLAQMDSNYQAELDKFGDEAYLMNFITNHDENSWNGTIEERLGEAGDAMAVLAFTIDGMPLIYSGQEAGLNKRLKFFEKDTINWDQIVKEEFYTTLLALKHENKALWNGKYGGKYTRVNTDNNSNIFCFYREQSDDRLVVALNLSAQKQSFQTTDVLNDAEFTEVFTQDKVNPSLWSNESVEMEPWSYIVLSTK
jgi:cyclomaltodextrinase